MIASLLIIASVLGFGFLIICSPLVILATNVWVLDGVIICMYINSKYGAMLPSIIEDPTLNKLALFAAFMAVFGLLMKKVKAVAIIVGVIFTAMFTYQMYIDCNLTWALVTAAISGILHIRSFYGEGFWDDTASSFMDWLEA